MSNILEFQINVSMLYLFFSISIFGFVFPPISASFCAFILVSPLLISWARQQMTINAAAPGISSSFSHRWRPAGLQRSCWKPWFLWSFQEEHATGLSQLMVGTSSPQHCSAYRHITPISACVFMSLIPLFSHLVLFLKNIYYWTWGPI